MTIANRLKTFVTSVSNFANRNLLLLPIAIIALSSLGRGVSNTLLFLYFVVSIFFVRWSSLRLNIGLFLLWVGMVIIMVVSGVVNDSLEIGQKQIIIYTMASMTLLFSLSHNNAVSIVFPRWWWWLLVLPFLIYLVRYWYYFSSELFEPEKQLSSLELAVLAPFLLIPLSQLFPRKMLQFLLLVGIILFIAIWGANSRAEIVMLFLGFSVMLAFLYKKSAFILLSFPLIILSLVFFNIFHDRQYLTFEDNLYEWTNKISSGRVEIWSVVNQYPPENMLLGSGVDNSKAFLPSDPDINPKGAALHNAYLEIWYETGFLGLTFWLLLFFNLLRGLPRAYREAEENHRIFYAAYLGSFVAVLIAGFLDKGYMSIYLKFFIYYLGAMLYLLGNQSSFDNFNQQTSTH